MTNGHRVVRSRYDGAAMTRRSRRNPVRLLWEREVDGVSASQGRAMFNAYDPNASAKRAVSIGETVHQSKSVVRPAISAL
jgi:hypothetical protein